MTPKIVFRHSDFNLYDDEEVALTDSNNEFLIQQLHKAFARFQTAGTIRKADKAGIKGKAEKADFPESVVEQDYKVTQQHLFGKTWKIMNLQEASFLIGLQGCLLVNEQLALLPYFFEIVLRAERWIWPFKLVFTPLDKKRPGFLRTAHENPELRKCIHEALVAARQKFKNDPEFREELSKQLDRRIINDWA
jgi:hypothetical protein